ncbi:hypothetical protein [Thalassomonas sp. M1454]|uniref:hypothetical protein n=1 Tax=Thalassomonas sp. M1454 TaxID=2594477 RepID=UPI00117BE068|nr:hypothetical protein [Thalassomonas sp. M1454]TRX56388.1 hypothetical protein FNN08_02330 [Thalassomonas sp. M1454]
MGKNIEIKEYSEQDFQAFQQVLRQQLTQLKGVLSQESFGDEPMQFGAELEMYLVDDSGQVSLSNQLLLSKLNDSQYQPELNKYNLELNLSPVMQTGKPFSNLLKEMQSKTSRLEQLAEKQNITIVPIGILPTLKAEDIKSENMTDLGRYHCLAKQLNQQKSSDFTINIDGEEPVNKKFKDICTEGANTSFQVHMMTDFKRFNHVFNAAQLTLPLVTAIAANSPILFGNSVWDETRIALFKQSLDIRHRDKCQWQQPTRVNFGFGWLRHSVWELFAEAVSLHQPILPVLMPTNNKTSLPKFEELSLHMGTLWPWHRPVYDHHGNGHMRIEFRAIPAGPTNIDMVANAAFAIGLANGLANDIEQYLPLIPFRFAEYNFYRAAQHGLDAKILWPDPQQFKTNETPICEVIEKLLPIAKQGLKSLDIDEDEINTYLAIIEDRCQQQMTGAIWQKKTLKYLKQILDKNAACEQMLKLYIENCKTAQPVATWSKPWL